MSGELGTNALRATVEAGDVALGVLDNAYSPALVERCGGAGVDFVWIDLEHGGPSPWDADRMADLLRAAAAGGTELLVRLPTTEPALVRKALDAGVRTLFFSRVETAEDVRRGVKAARFSYDGEPGKRGLASPRASGWGLVEDYPEREDAETMVGATIENRTAVENMDDILSVPDLGFVFVGPYDLSVAYGHPGDLDHPDVREAVETVRSSAVEHDVALGGLGFGMDDVNEKAAEGYQILNVGSTVGAVADAMAGKLDAFDGPTGTDGD